MSQAGQAGSNGGGGGGPVRTITGDTGGPVPPNGLGNINIDALYTNSVIGNPGSSTLTITPTSRGYPITPYVVGPVGFGGYQTIQSALNAIGVNGSGQIWLYPGTYTEDLVFPSGISVGIITGSDENAGSVNLIGTHDPSLAANIITWRVQLTSGASGHIFSSNAAGTGQITLVHNNLVCNGYIFNLPNFTAAAGLTIGLMADRLSTASGVINNTGGAFFGSFENTLGVGSTFPAIMSGPSVIEVNNWSCPIQTQGSANINFYDSNFFAPMTLGGATNGFITNNYHTTGSSACITYNSTSNTLLSTCVLDSSNNPCIAGSSSGTLTMGGLTFVTDKNISALVTKAGATGFFASNLTNHGVVLGQGNACLGVTAAGLTGQVLMGNTGADPSWQTPAASGYPITPYVVGQVGKAGYQTVQAAVNAANLGGGGLVYLQEGTYTENLTLFPNVNLQGAVDSAVLIGVHTPPTTGTTTFDSLILISATDIFNSNAAGSASLNVNNAFILVTDGYVFNLPNWTGEILMDNCGEASTNDGVINNSGGSPVKLINVEVGAGTTRTMNVTSSNFLRIDTCNVNCPVNMSGTGSLIIQNGVKFANTVTIGGSLSGFIIQTVFSTGSNIGLIYNSSGNTYFADGVVNSTNNPAIDGSSSGLLTLSGISFVNNKNISPLVNHVGGGGFLAAQLTNHGVVLGQGNACLGVTAAGLTGQVLTGNTGADPSWQTPAASGITTIQGDTGSITGPIVSIKSAATAGSSTSFSGSGTAMTFNVSDASLNTIIGFDAGNATLTSNQSTAIGGQALHALTSGVQNTACGYNSLNRVTSGQQNSALGIASLSTITTGIFNIGIGSNAGTSYSTSESSNIAIGNTGIVGESNVCRIGTKGTGNGEVNQTFLIGPVNIANQPAFSANNASTATPVTGDGTAYTIGSTQTAWTEIYDLASNFNTNGTFTAPTTGQTTNIYHFTGSVGLTGIDATNTGVVVQIVTSKRSYTGFTCAPFPIVISGALVLNWSCDADMDAGDTAVMQVTVFGSGKNVNVQSSAANTFFQGRLVC